MRGRGYYGAVAGRPAVPGRAWPGRARLRETLSHRAVVSRGDVIRPSTTDRKVTLTDVGVHLGSTLDGGMPLAVSAEDPVLVLSAPRQGKTSQVIIPRLHTWPGPAWPTCWPPQRCAGRTARWRSWPPPA